MNKSVPSTFIQCWDTEANKPQNLVACRLFPNAEAVRTFVSRQFRNLEYRAHEIWDQLKHGHKTIYPVPLKHVLFDAPKEGFKPRSVLIVRKPFPRNPKRQSILKGA